MRKIKYKIAFALFITIGLFFLKLFGLLFVFSVPLLMFFYVLYINLENVKK
jgi:hypothetical protein